MKANSFHSDGVSGAFRKCVRKYVEFVYVDSPHLITSHGTDTASASPETIDETSDDSQSTEPNDGVFNDRSWWFNKEDNTFKGTNKNGPAYGFDVSLRFLEEVWQTQGPFHGLMGFSQGACFVALICNLAMRGSKLTLSDAMSVNIFPSFVSSFNFQWLWSSHNLPFWHLASVQAVWPIQITTRKLYCCHRYMWLVIQMKSFRLRWVRLWSMYSKNQLLFITPAVIILRPPANRNQFTLIFSAIVCWSIWNDWNWIRLMQLQWRQPSSYRNRKMSWQLAHRTIPIEIRNCVQSEIEMFIVIPMNKKRIAAVYIFWIIRRDIDRCQIPTHRIVNGHWDWRTETNYTIYRVLQALIQPFTDRIDCGIYLVSVPF